MAQPLRIFFREDINLNVAIRGTTDFSAAGNVTDDDGQRAFALVQLAPYISDVRVDVSMLWTLGAKDLGGGFREVKVLRDTTQTLNGLWGQVRDGTVVGVHPSRPDAPNAVWKFAPVYQQ
nr:unnamed protein product [Digitaria exilis]